MITGGLGVNGAWVIRDLLERGHEVSVYENRDDTSLVEDVADRIEIVVGDLRDLEALTAAVERLRPECIIHLAALVDDRVPYTTIEVNTGGTANVAAAAVAAGVKRVVYTSSKAVYGPTTGARGYPTYEPIPEDGAVNPSVMYSITKLAGEQVLEWYARTTGLEIASLRFGTIYGPGRLQRHQGINAYSSMVELPAVGEAFRVENGGDERDDIVYVLDVADAISTVALAPHAPRHAVYNVSGGDAVTMSEYAAAIHRVIPNAALEVGPGLDPMNQGDAPYYMQLDGTRIEDEYGWRASYDINRAVQHYYDFVRSRA
jgi:UDP-glucose 4-epimerase